MNYICIFAIGIKMIENMKKTWFFTLLMTVTSVCMAESTPGLTILFKNQTKVSFTFASKPNIAVGDNGITISSSNSASVSYTFANVQKFCFEDDVVDTGIQEVKAGSATHPVFSCNNGVIAVSGLKAAEHVNVFSIDGSKIGEAKADNAGCASVGLSGTTNGVYVVSTDSGVSFKILKK